MEIKISNQDIFSPDPDLSGHKNLFNFINYAKNSLTLYSDQEFSGRVGWDSYKWHSVRKSVSGKKAVMLFGFSDNTTYEFIRPFSSPFIDFSKAYVRKLQSAKEVNNIEKSISALRHIHLALEAIHAKHPVNIMNLDGDVILEVENIIRSSKYVNSTKAAHGDRVSMIYDWLRKNHILPALPVWKNPFKMPVCRSQRTGVDNKEWTKERCPTNYQMIMFADCFANAKTIRDKYMTSLGVLLIHAPSRQSEIYSLDINTLQHDGENYYVQWHGAKGFGAKREPVMECMVPVVKKAISQLIEISAPARKVAKWAYNNPNKFFRHEGCSTPKGFSDDAPLTPVQFADAIGVRNYYYSKDRRGNKVTLPTLWSVFQSIWIKNILDENDRKITYNVLGKYFYNKYSKIGWKIPGSDRPIWESLILYREGEVDLNKPLVKGYSWTFPPVKNLNYDLGSERKSHKDKIIKNIWDRFGLKDEDGSPLKLTTHQFRVWLNTHAQRMGVGDVDIALWSGRASPKQNAAYDLRTEEEIKSGAFGIINSSYTDRPDALALQKMNLPITCEQVDIDRFDTIEYTELGACGHDYGQSPCLKCGECITCKEFLCIKGFSKSLERMKDEASLIVQQLKKSKESLGEIEFGKDRWSTNMGWKLAHYLTFIKMLEDEDISDGSVLRIPLSHDPSPIRRELIKQGLVVDNYDQEITKKPLDEDIFEELLEMKI